MRIDLYGVTSGSALCSKIEEAVEREELGAGWNSARAKLLRRGGGVQLPAVSLTPMPPEALGAYIEDRFAATDRRIGTALGPLLDLVRGHPRAAMIVAHALWEEVEPDEQADEAAWEWALRRLPEYVTEDEMRARWDSLTPTQRTVAEIIARREGSPLSAAIPATDLHNRPIGEVAYELTGRTREDLLNDLGSQARLMAPDFDEPSHRRLRR